MNELFPMLLLGHLTGDFIFQNKWMAMNKSASSWKCLVHCLIYTASVCTFTSHIIPGLWWPAFVFMTHFPIDRWSLADKWLDIINGRSLRDFVFNGKDNIPSSVDFENYHALRAGFTGVVYTAVDNTMHLVLMYLGAQIFFL